MAAETIVLIKKRAKENQLWGAEQIQGELLKLEVDMSKQTIQGYMPKDRKEQSSKHIVSMRLQETWAPFLKNQASGI